MPDSQLSTQQAAMAKAAIMRASLANSKLRLCKAPIVFNIFTTRTQLEAAEADFDGYPAGGYTLSAWLAPTLDPLGGANLTSPIVNVVYGPAGTPPVGNSLTGWWIEDSTGNVRLIGEWSPARPVQVEGDGFAVVIQTVEGRNANMVSV